MLLNNTGAQCGNQTPPGTEVDLYYTCTCEMNGFPATLADGGGTVLGDKFKLNEPFDFSTAPVGSGYWRQTKLLVDTGAFKALIEGELGGQSGMSQIRGFLIGSDAERAEVMDNFRRYSGCLSLMIKGKDAARSVVIGKPSIPAQVESAEMDSGEKAGDKNGTAYVFKASHLPYYYDDATDGIDVTPNP